MKKNILTLLCLVFIGMFANCTNKSEKKVPTDISTQHGPHQEP